jgi:hypothetical protein
VVAVKNTSLDDSIETHTNQLGKPVGVHDAVMPELRRDLVLFSARCAAVGRRLKVILEEQGFTARGRLRGHPPVPAAVEHAKAAQVGVLPVAFVHSQHLRHRRVAPFGVRGQPVPDRTRMFARYHELRTGLQFVGPLPARQLADVPTAFERNSSHAVHTEGKYVAAVMNCHALSRVLGF